MRLPAPVATHLASLFVWSKEFTAPRLVHTSSSRVCIPILASLSRNEAVDSLLVLLQKRKGNDEARMRCIACGAMETGWVSMWIVPERSISSALMTGRFNMICGSAMGTVGCLMIGRLCVSQCHGLVDRFAE